MFWACFTYDHKGPCHIYYPETEEQKAKNEEIGDEAREAFKAQERKKEKKWDEKGQL